MQDGYKSLITYKLARTAFDLVWDFVPLYYWRMEDARQRDQMKQAVRSHKQNIVEGSSDRSLSSKLTLYDVSQSSGKEVKEDCEDILRLEGLPVWDKDDPRLLKLRSVFESSPNPPLPSTSSVLRVLGKEVGESSGIEGGRGIRRIRKEEVEIIANYAIDLLARNGYLLDRQIRAVEEKHRTEGGYRETLLKKRLAFRRLSVLLYFLLLPSTFLYFLLFAALRPAYGATTQATFTVSFWVKPKVAVATTALAVKNTEIRFYTGADSKPVCQIHNGTDWQTGATSATALSLNAWQYVTCTYDRTNIKVFINGVQQGSQALALDVNDTANAWRIGSDEGGTYADLNGSIDDVRIYNYARSAKQIVQDMNAGRPAVGSPVGSAVAYYKFDEGYGTVAHNSGNGGSTLNGTLGTGNSAPSWSQNGKFGKALSFDGGDFLTVPDNNSLDITSSITLSTWIKRNGSGVTDRIINKDHSGTAAAWGMQVLNTNKLAFFVTTDGNNGNDRYCTGNINIADTNWHYITASYDGTYIKLFVDGKVDKTGKLGSTGCDSGTLYTGDLITSDQPLFIGRVDWSGTSYYLNGLIDEVKIYNYALTEDEVKVEYNRGSALVLGSTSTGTGNTDPNNAASQEYCIPGDASTCSAPIARWDFNEGIGTTAMDSSGNGNTGTLGAGDSAPSWTSGKVGKGLSFDGVKQYVDMGNNPNLSTSNNISVEAWVYPLTTDLGMILNDYDKGVSGWFLSLHNTWGFTIANYQSIGNQKIATVNSLPALRQWYHLVGLIYGDGSQPKLYVNGVAAQTNIVEGTVTQLNLGSNTTKVGIQSNPATERGFSGLIDQVQIYNYARTPAQIAWDYNRGAPVAWYKMDECQGTTIHSSNTPYNSALNGTLNVGATAPQTSAGTCTDGLTTSAWYNGASGKFNASLKYDGQDDYTQVTDTANLRFDANTADFSLFAWAKRTTTGTEYIISKEDADNDGYRLMFNSSNQVLCSEDATDVTSTATITDTSWHLIGCTIDRDGNGRIYIDGRADGATVAMGTDAMATTANIRIATRSYTSTNYFNGQIDDVRIYNYALTATQIKTLYNDGAVKFGN